MANPFMEDISFNDFLKRYRTTPGEEKVQDDYSMNKEQLTAQVNKASNLLKGFVPPKKGGVE